MRPRLYNAGRRVYVQHWRCGEHNQAGREEFPTGTDSFPCSHSSLKRHTTNIDRILKPIDVSLCPHRKKVINYIIQFSVNINCQLNRRKSNNKKNQRWMKLSRACPGNLTPSGHNVSNTKKRRSLFGLKLSESVELVSRITVKLKI